MLTDVIANNVFQIIIDDSENFLFADIEIAEGTSLNWSYPWWPSHIDHILITNELMDEFENVESEIQTIKIDEYMDGGFDDYYDNIYKEIELIFNCPKTLYIGQNIKYDILILKKY